MAVKPQNGMREIRKARNANIGLLGSVFLFSVFVNLLMLTGPLFMLQIYDRVLGSRSEETLVALVVLVAALYFLMALLDYARGRVMARFGMRFQSRIEERVFNAVMNFSVKTGNDAKASTGLRDLETFQSIFTSPVLLALFDIPWTPIFIAAIFIFHPLLGWISVAGGVILIVITLLNNWTTRAKTNAAQTSSFKAQNFADQAERSSGLIRAQGMNKTFLERWLAYKDVGSAQTIHASDWTGLFSSFTKSFRLFLQSAILAVGAWLTLRGEMTAGAMIAGSILLGRALAPVEQTIGQWSVVQRAIAVWKSLGNLLTVVPPDPDTIMLPRPKSRLAFTGVSVVAPGTNRPILANVSFSLDAGQALGVIGKSGSGKSTLARTLMGLSNLAAGEIRLDGATLAQFGPENLGRYVGYLPQDVTLFSGTIEENISRMQQEPDAKRVIHAAKRAKAHELILSLPDGYKTQLLPDDNILSGGQKQRIALARALYSDPVLLVLDEPNSALDGEGSEALNEVIREFKSLGRSAILMTHRPLAISECDRLVVLEQGRVRANGPRDEVLQSMLKNADDVKQAITRKDPQ